MTPAIVPGSGRRLPWRGLGSAGKEAKGGPPPPQRRGSSCCPRTAQGPVAGRPAPSQRPPPWFVSVALRTTGTRLWSPGCLRDRGEEPQDQDRHERDGYCTKEQLEGDAAAGLKDRVGDHAHQT